MKPKPAARTRRWRRPQNKRSRTWTSTTWSTRRFGTTTSRTVRIAVTGASGVLGRGLTARLLSQGHEVVGIARHRPDSWPSSADFIPTDIPGLRSWWPSWPPPVRRCRCWPVTRRIERRWPR
nr:NAD-dependent epimerase/dehydratase family protein [Mycobacterium tuberculosis]